jgi:hypothetical protein
VLSFHEFNELLESKRKKKSKPNIPKKANDPLSTMIISVADQRKTAIGHQKPAFRTGPHAQGEPRKRTRSQQKVDLRRRQDD